MKAINYILGFGAFAAAVVAAIFCSRVCCWAAFAAHDLPLAASCCFGAVWFAALAVKFICWAVRQAE